MPELAPQRQAVLLLAHGTPESLDQIPEYLRNVTGGRPMPESVIEEIRHRYSLIGSSPLTELTLEQGRLLSQALDLPVYVGMRNWKPYIADVVRQMRADGITSAVVICLAPQNSRTSVGLYRRAAFAEAAGAIEMDFIDGWADHPLLAQAFAERLQPVWQNLSARIGSMAPVLFTAHSVPCRTIQGSSAENRARLSPTPTRWRPSALQPMWPRCWRPWALPPPTGFLPSRARACPAPPGSVPPLRTPSPRCARKATPRS